MSLVTGGWLNHKYVKQSLACSHVKLSSEGQVIRKYLNLSKLTQTAAGLKALKPAANRQLAKNLADISLHSIQSLTSILNLRACNEWLTQWLFSVLGHQTRNTHSVSNHNIIITDTYLCLSSCDKPLSILKLLFFVSKVAYDFQKD